MMIEKAKKQGALLRHMLVAVVAMSAVQAVASEQKATGFEATFRRMAGAFDKKEAPKAPVTKRPAALPLEVKPAVVQQEIKRESDQKTILLKAVDLNDCLSDDEKLLLTDPGEAYKKRNEIMGFGHSITGHNGRSLGWEKSPQEMHMFAEVVAASILEASKKKDRVRVLHVGPRGSFTDWVIWTHVASKKPSIKAEALRLLRVCGDREGRESVLTRVSSCYPASDVEDRYYPKTCLEGIECSTCNSECAVEPKRHPYDVLYGCNENNIKDGEKLYGFIKKWDAMGIALVLQKDGITMRTVGDVPHVDHQGGKASPSTDEVANIEEK